MSSQLLRPPEPADFEPVFEVIVARDVADLGQPDYTPEDLRHDWEDPEVDLARDAWVAGPPGGPLTGYGLLQGEDALAIVHPEAEGRGIGTALLERVQARARERGIGVLRQVVAAGNEPARRLLEAGGWRASLRFWRMRVELGAPPPSPSWPEGIAVRPFAPGPDDEAVHGLIQAACAELADNVPRSLEAWRTALVRPDFAPELSTVAYAGERLAGVALCRRWPDGTGFVSQLAVEQEQRGRGLGRSLLRASMVGFHATGLTAAELGVQSDNRAGVALYESVGMRPVMVIDRFERRLTG